MKTSLITHCTSSNKSFISQVISVSAVKIFGKSSYLTRLFNCYWQRITALLKKKRKTILTWRQAVKQYIQGRQVGQLFLFQGKQSLKLYLSYGFSLQKIADVFGTSNKTISRRVKSYNLREEVPKYDNISNESWDRIVSAVLHNFNKCGIRRMKGFLIGWDIRVQWSRVRSSLWRTDPSGILLRTSQLNIARVGVLTGAIIVFQDPGHYGI